MDYSTISNKTNCTEAEELTNGGLREQYYLLRKKFQDLSRDFESTKQELHDTKRSYQTAFDVQVHLSAEIASLEAEEERNRCKLNSRITALNEELAQFRVERTEILDHHATEIKKYEDQIRNLREKQALKDRDSPERDNCELDEARAAVNVALQQAAEAKALLEEAKVEVMSWRLKTEELVSEIEEMKAAAEIRREELREASDREAVASAELAKAKAMLQCKDSQDLKPHAAKGNSIFAEVEDKSQEMSKNLIKKKQINSRLRRDLANKKAELEALLHEKKTVWEQQAREPEHYDRELIENYEERITQLEVLFESQRREIARWFGSLAESSANGWLPGVLDHLKSECSQLRAEVVSLGAGQLASAAQVRDLRRQLALQAATAPHHPARHSPPNWDDTADDTTTQDNALTKMPAQIQKFSKDDVKKKVSFN